MPVIGVYMIEHIPTGRRYVGKSVDVARRTEQHLCGKSGGCTYLEAAIKKHGREAFAVSLLERCATEDVAGVREAHWIRLLGTRAPSGFNLTDGGDGVSGLVWGEESRACKSEATLGHKHSLETRARMSAAHKAFYATPRGLSALSERPKGIKRSADTRARMSAAQKGKKASAETREKIRKAKSNPSDETRAKLRISALTAHAKKRAARQEAQCPT